MQRKSVLRQLKKRVTARDFYLTGFAMLNCASSIRDKSLEGDTLNCALAYLSKIVAVTDDVLGMKDINIADELLQLQCQYPTTYQANDKNFLKRLWQEIETYCHKKGCCYLPAGWAGNPGHYVTLKVKKSDDGYYDISFLNRGAGIQFHATTAISDEKTKYNYESYVYRFVAGSESLDLFLHGIVSLSIASFSHEKNESILYGLLALHGELKREQTNDLSHAVTAQRSGTCALTNARAAIKDYLIMRGYTAEQTKHYEFVNKLASIVAAYEKLKEEDKNQLNSKIGEQVAELLSIALRELYVRLEKLYPEVIGNEELLEVKAFADEISQYLKKRHEQVLGIICSEKEFPEFIIDVKPDKNNDISANEGKKQKQFEMVDSGERHKRFDVRIVEPAELINYISLFSDNWLSRYQDIRCRPFTYELNDFLLSLHPTTGEAIDPYWDHFDEASIHTIIEKLASLRIVIDKVNKNNDAKKYVQSLIIYDIAAQLAPRCKELKMGDQYCFGLDDTFSENYIFDDPVDYLMVSNIANNFKKRSSNRFPLFTNTILIAEKADHPNTKLMQTYIKQFVNHKVRDALAGGNYINNRNDPSDYEWLKMYLTQVVKSNDGYNSDREVNLFQISSETLNNVYLLAGFCQSGFRLSPVYTAHYNRYNGSDLTVFYIQESKFKNDFVMMDSYHHNYNASMRAKSENVFLMLPYNDLPSDLRQFRDFSESAIYQPEKSRVRHKSQRDANNIQIPWSQAYNFDLSVLEPYTYGVINRWMLLDEAMKRLQLDESLLFQRGMVWLGDHIHLADKRNQFDMSHLYKKIFKYGVVFRALTESDTETNQIVCAALNQCYKHFQIELSIALKKNQIQMFNDLLTNYLYITGIESNYRLWAVALNKPILTSGEFPSCQYYLRELLTRVRDEDKLNIAIALITNLNALKPLNNEDYQYLLASRILIATLQKETSNLASWAQLENELFKHLESLSSDELSLFMNDVVKHAGIANVIGVNINWKILGGKLFNEDAQIEIDLMYGIVKIDGQCIEFCGIDNINKKAVKLLNELGIKCEGMRITNRKFTVGDVNVAYQVDMVDGRRYYLEPTKSDVNIFTYVEFENESYFCRLDSVSNRNRKNANKYDLPFIRESDKSDSIWHASNGFRFIMHPSKPNKAMVCEHNDNFWQQVIKTKSGWVPTGKVIMFTSAMTAWNEYLASYLSSQNTVRYIGVYNRDDSRIELRSIHFINRNLHFDVRERELNSREYYGYKLSKQQAAKELNGLARVVTLVNEKGEKKHFIPYDMGLLRFSSESIYTRHPFENEPTKRFMVASVTYNDLIKVDTPRENLELAVIFALQGDFISAMRHLNESYSHLENEPYLLSIMQSYNKVKPNTPESTAFMLHLYLRLLAHQGKWGKQSFDIGLGRDDIKDMIAENKNQYINYISSLRDNANIIPQHLMFTESELSTLHFSYPIKNPELITKPSFKDKLFSSTNHAHINKRLLNDLYRDFAKIPHAVMNLPYFPPESLDVAMESVANAELKDYVETMGAHDAGWAMMAIYFRELFILAISEKKGDTERLYAFLYQILHIAVRNQTTLFAVSLLRYVNNSRSDFLNINIDKHRCALLIEIASQLVGQKLDLTTDRYISNVDKSFRISEYFTKEASFKISYIEKLKHWLKETASTKIDLSNYINTSDVSEPLGLLFLRFIDKQVSALTDNNTPFLKLDDSVDLTPIELKIINNYRDGYETNKTRLKIKYTLKNSDVDELAAELNNEIDSLENKAKAELAALLNVANELSNDSEHRNLCNMIEIARESGKRPLITMADIINSILTQNTKELHHRNPLLTQSGIDKLMKQACDYMLTVSKLNQCKEATSIIAEIDSRQPVPEHVQHQLGEVLAKKRSYKISDYPELLAYEYLTTMMLRDNQTEKILEIIKIIETEPNNNKKYRLALLQFAAAGGKTAVIIPILAHRFARKGLLPVIMNTTELYDIAIQEIPDSLKRSLHMNIEVIEKDLDFEWTVSHLQKLENDLELWRLQHRCLLLTSVSWHSINLAYKRALDVGDLMIAEQAKRVLDFFSNRTVKLEDEGHLISDPLQESIHTNKPTQEFTTEQKKMMLQFYHHLSGNDRESAELVKLTGINDKSKKLVTKDELYRIQFILTHHIYESEFHGFDREMIFNYFMSPSKDRPEWLNELHDKKPDLANNIVMARSFIQTHLPYILSLQYKRDYGVSIHQNDLTAAPKHDETDVTSHFADPLLVLSLSTQMYYQQGVPKNYMASIFMELLALHKKQSVHAGMLTDAEIQIMMLLPDQYLHRNMDDLTVQELSDNEELRFHEPILQYFINKYVYPQIKVPTRLYASTPADLQAGFKAGVIFTATPGLCETYPVQLNPENQMLAKEFEAEVISTLLAAKNKQAVMIQHVKTPLEFFEQIKLTNPEQFSKMTAMIDRGAILSDYDNVAISAAIQSMFLDDLKRANTLYFNGNIMQIDSRETLQPVKLKGTRIVEALREQGFSLEQVMLFLFLNLSRTTGTDVKRPLHDRAGVTIGKEQTLTDTIQAAMRERQLLREDGQTVLWILFKSLYEIINPGVESFELNEVMLWMIRNQAKNDEQKILARAYQGIEQLINDYIINNESQSDSNKLPLKKHENDSLFSKEIKLSMWDMYELISKDADTETVLTYYINTLCNKFNISRDAMPDEIKHNLRRIIDETKSLIPIIPFTHTKNLSAKVTYEQHVQQSQEQMNEQEQSQQQQTRQTMTTNSDYHSMEFIRFALETYDKTDNLEAIFKGKNKKYEDMKLVFKRHPGNRFVGETHHIIWNSNQFEIDPTNRYFYNINYHKPIENFIMQVSEKGRMQFLACTEAGIKYFHLQLDQMVFDANTPKYVICDRMGNVMHKSSNCSSEDITKCKDTDEFNDVVCYLSFLAGEIFNPEKMSAYIKRHNIHRDIYVHEAKFILKSKITHTEFQLLDSLYLESLCGWRVLDQRIQKRLAHKIHGVPAQAVVATRVTHAPLLLPENAKPGYLPDAMKPILAPCLLGLELQSPCIAANDAIITHSHPDEELYERLRSVTLMAIDQYLKFNQASLDKSQAITSGEFFSRLKHSSKGVGRANLFKASISSAYSKDKLLTLLHGMFTNKDTRYRPNSLSTYLLYAISRLLVDMKLPPIPCNNDKSYNKETAWFIVLERLDSYIPKELRVSVEMNRAKKNK